MIKLSDYLNYLSTEIIKARKAADLQSIQVAKEYAQHEYLRYFKAPRFSMPTIKLEIPIKISELDAETKYNFSMDEELFIRALNSEIGTINETHNLRIRTVKKDRLNSESFRRLARGLERKDNRFVRKLDEFLEKVDYEQSLDLIEAAEVDDPRVRAKLVNALKSAAKSCSKPVSVKLNDIYVNPESKQETNKDEILLKLNVEMVEEGLRITKVQSTEGREVEEIVFE